MAGVPRPRAGDAAPAPRRSARPSFRRCSRGEAPILIDVLPAPRPPEDRAGARLWRAKPRANIPGSVWLPNVGYGELSAEFQAYFANNLARLTDGDRSRRLVFYCQADCWMSWNAAKRAVQSGYGNVVWYPEGTDGWAAAGLPLEPAAAGADAGLRRQRRGQARPES